MAVSTSSPARVLIAAHYLPYALHSIAGEKHASSSSSEASTVLERRRDHAPLFSGVHAVTSHEQHYFGILSHASQKHAPHSSFDTSTREALRARRCTPVSVSDSCHSAFYEGYCKKVLWPIMHYITWDSYLDRQKEAHYWGNYVTLNQAFADAICESYRPDDLSTIFHSL